MKILSTKEKAVKINIDSKYYGTVAEIGGGQETARHLFQAGGASNTVAKTVSAYDKLFSDYFYNEGKPSRYVDEGRLRKMVRYFSQFRIIKLRIVMGLPTFDKVLDGAGYTDLRDGILQMMGALFTENVKVYLYPSLNPDTGEIVYADDARLAQYVPEGVYRSMKEKRIFGYKELSDENK